MWQVQMDFAIRTPEIDAPEIDKKKEKQIFHFSKCLAQQRCVEQRFAQWQYRTPALSRPPIQQVASTGS